MRIVIAEDALRERILDQTFPLWNEGLSRQAYGRWNEAQLRTAWGRTHLHRIALVDEQGALLATAKRYRFDVRVGGHAGTMCGIGAVFTPPGQRGRGYASTLIEMLLSQERAHGVLMASLFSEIGTTFYARLGFSPIPLDEVSIAVKRKAGAPAMLVRGGEERDLAAVAAMHDTRSADAAFALRRDAALVQYALAKKRLLAGLGPAGRRQIEFFVAEEGASAVAYVVLHVNPHGWTLEEAGDRDPAGARLGAMLQALVAREPHRAPLTIRTWWPRSFAVPPQLELRDRVETRDVFMIRPLADNITMPRTADDVFYWRSDFF